MSSALGTTLLKIALGLGVAYLAVAILAWRFQARLAFPGPDAPLPDPVEAGFPSGERIEVRTRDGVTLRGWYVPPQTAASHPAPALLWFYGNMETIAQISSLLGTLRPPHMALLVLDYRGYGASDGTQSERGIYLDAEAAWAHLTAREAVDPERIAVFGNSIGTVPALYLATERPVKAVVLASPFTHARAMARVHYGWLPRSLVNLSLDNLARAKRLEAPVLVAQGTADRIVPPWMGRAIADAASELVVIRGAGHNDLTEVGGADYVARVQSFLDRALNNNDSRGR